MKKISRPVLSFAARRPAAALCVTAALLLAACAPQALAPLSAAVTMPPRTASPLPAAVPTWAGTGTAAVAAAVTAASPSPSVSPSSLPTTGFQVCSPLEGITLAELGQPDLLKNPLQTPRPGMDDGHHGADFAYWSRGERAEMLGLPVQAVLAGRVAGVIHNRPPYGYAVIIETPLDEIPPAWLANLPAPTPAPIVTPAPNLYCPAPLDEALASTGRSLYLLYAHLNQDPPLTTGQPVTCGQPIGEVGTTGMSVNPHLHLETRVGPAAATFAEMAHYDNAATEGEMRSYCAWRVSGLFQMFDPMSLIALHP